MNASFLTPKNYLMYDDEKLQRVNQTVTHYLRKPRSNDTEELDTDVKSEIDQLEKAYYKLTRNTGITSFKAMLREKWSAVYVFSLLLLIDRAYVHVC